MDTHGTPQPPGAFYSIPRDNLFFDDTNPPLNIRQEIFALGFRNPWRWSFDRQTGDLWIGNVGQGAWEEIDFLPYVAHNPPAHNLGWNIREGTHCYPPGTPSCPTSGLVDPVLEYPHPPGTPPQDCSVTGGYRYRGTKPENAELQGIYFYADFCTGRIWKGVQFGSSWKSIEAPDTDLNISGFGEDESGELSVHLRIQARRTGFTVVQKSLALVAALAAGYRQRAGAAAPAANRSHQTTSPRIDRSRSSSGVTPK